MHMLCMWGPQVSIRCLQLLSNFNIISYYLLILSVDYDVSVKNMMNKSWFSPSPMWTLGRLGGLEAVRLGGRNFIY